MSGTVTPALADATPVRLTAVDRVLLDWLRANAVDGKVQASTRFIHEETSRDAGAIGRSARKLESAGLLTIIKSQRRSIPNVYVLADLHTERPTRTVSPSEGLPDCFRAGDLRSAGQLWQAAEKGVEYRPRDILPLAPVGTAGGVSSLLKKLEALPVPAVTSRPNPRRPDWRLYTFNDLTESDQGVILADLQTRTSWRPITRAETEARHADERAELLERTGVAAYVDLLDEMMKLVYFDEFGCWMWGGEVDRTCGGYAIVDGVNPASGIRGHRITYHALIGPPPLGYELHHFFCGKPACINPRHLVAVTKEEHRELTRADKWITDWEKFGTVRMGSWAPPLLSSHSLSA